MANELVISNVPTGSTVYAVRVRQSDGKWWNSSTYEVYNVANWTTYDIAMSEVGALGIFKADDPDSATAGYAHYYKQTGGSPAATDTYLGGEAVAQTSGGTAPNITVDMTEVRG